MNRRDDRHALQHQALHRDRRAQRHERNGLHPLQWQEGRPRRQKPDGSALESRWGYIYPGATPWRRKTSGANAHDGGPSDEDGEDAISCAAAQGSAAGMAPLLLMLVAFGILGRHRIA